MIRDATHSKLQIGMKMPYFSLRGTDGRIYSAAEFRSRQAIVIVFTCNHCPFSQAYEMRLIDLAKRFAPLGVQVVTICSNDAVSFPNDSFEQMVEKSRSWGFPFPYLHDETQIAARAFDAVCTPECYLFDEERRLRYHGRIDDNYADPERVTRQDLALAIEAVLAHQEPETPLTSLEGCSIKWQVDYAGVGRNS